MSHDGLLSSAACRLFAKSRLSRIDWHTLPHVTDDWILSLFGIDSSTVTPVVAGLPVASSSSSSSSISISSSSASVASSSGLSSPQLRARTSSAWAEEKSPLLIGSNAAVSLPPLPAISTSLPLVNRPLQMPSPLHQSLTDVKLSQCVQLTDDALRPLAYCYRLTHLYLAGTPMHYCGHIDICYYLFEYGCLVMNEQVVII